MTNGGGGTSYLTGRQGVTNGGGDIKNAIGNPLKKQSRTYGDHANILPNWARNRCQNISNINATDCTETDEEKHENACFSEL